MRFKAALLLIVAVVFAFGPFLVPEFRGFDPALYPIPQIDPPVQPAGYAFAIWGVIYLWLLIHAAFGLFKRTDTGDWDPMRWPLIVSLAIGAAWLSVAMVSPLWSVILIFAMLAFALMALYHAPMLDPWLARAPVALYAGWLTAASFAGLGLLGAGYGLLFGEIGWAYLCLAGAFVTALLGHRMRPDAPLYTAGVAWALVAIAAKNSGVNWGLTVSAMLAALILLTLSARALNIAKRAPDLP